MEKRTKIVATISDMNCDVSFLQSLFDAGVNVFRTNTAHQQPEDTLKILNNVRAVSKTAPVMVDTKGPEIRTTPLKDQEVPVKTGDKLIFKGGSKELTSAKTIYLNYDGFHKNIDNGASILYDDGEIEFKVVEKHSDHLVVEVLNDGVIKGKKSVNVPGVSLNLPSLTEKDKMYVKFVAENDVDFIAHSFIRHKEDLKAVQDILDEHKSSAKIIAKIENQEGVDNIDEILDNCAGIMVARGDLAIEIPTERVPPIQKRLIKRAIEKRKIVITATQMLHTMIDNPRPTRAEVSDVANAVYDGSDCVMLSGESAYGKYPLESVQIMNKIIREVEKQNTPLEDVAIKTLPSEGRNFLAKSALEATMELPIKAIFTDTLTGRTARYLSAFRGNVPIFALTYDERTMRELAFSFGVRADIVKPRADAAASFQHKITELVELQKLKHDDLIVIISGNFGPKHGATSLNISTVENFLA